MSNSEEWIGAMDAARQLKIQKRKAISVMIRNQVRRIRNASGYWLYHSSDVAMLASILPAKACSLNPKSQTERDTRAESVKWLEQYMVENGGCVKPSKALQAGKAAGHGKTILYRAKMAIGLTSRRCKSGGMRWDMHHEQFSAVVERDPSPQPEYLATRTESVGSRAQIWLKKYLAENGCTKTSEILRAAALAGHAHSPLYRARAELGITSHRLGFGENGAHYWDLPKDEQILPAKQGTEKPEFTYQIFVDQGASQ